MLEQSSVSLVKCFSGEGQERPKKVFLLRPAIPDFRSEQMMQGSDHCLKIRLFRDLL